MTQKITTDALAKLVAHILQDGLGVPVLVKDRAGPRPSTPYAVVGIVTTQRAAHDDVVFDAESDTEGVTGESYVTGIVVCLGAGALDRANLAMSILSASARIFDLSPVLGFSGFDPAQKTSFLFRGKIEERAEVRFYGYALLGADLPAEFFTRSQWALTVDRSTSETTIPDGE